MAKLTSLKSQIGSLKPRLPSVVQAATQYGKGRGGRPWRRLREEVLKRDDYRCQHCKAQGLWVEATEVDHVIPLAEGGADMDKTNLQSLCSPCHEAKTHEEAKRGVLRVWNQQFK